MPPETSPPTQTLSYSNYSGRTLEADVVIKNSASAKGSTQSNLGEGKNNFKLTLNSSLMPYFTFTLSGYPDIWENSMLSRQLIVITVIHSFDLVCFAVLLKPILCSI